MIRCFKPILILSSGEVRDTPMSLMQLRMKICLLRLASVVQVRIYTVRLYYIDREFLLPQYREKTQVRKSHLLKCDC